MAENTNKQNKADVNNEAANLPAEVEVVGINFREAGKIDYFAPKHFSFSIGDRVIVETARGVEIGSVKVPNKSIPESDVVPPLKQV